MKIKRGDNVIVITGKDKGKTGKVTRVEAYENKVVIEGLNIRKRHRRARRSNEKGQIIEVAHPMDVSNIAVIDPRSGKQTRIGYRLEGGKKIRYAKKSGTVI
jgi:large subunit ribosomal protein L24